MLVYTGYIAFTNYGTGHNGSQGAGGRVAHDLVARSASRTRPTYPVTVVEQLGDLGLLVTDPDGDVLVGTHEPPLDRGRRRDSTAARPSRVDG